MPMEDNTKDTGTKTADMGKALSVFTTKTVILANIKRARLVAKESTHGIMGKYMTASGKTASSMGMVFGKDSIMTPILASGTKVKRTDKAYTPGKTVIVTKDSGNTL